MGKKVRKRIKHKRFMNKRKAALLISLEFFIFAGLFYLLSISVSINPDHNIRSNQPETIDEISYTDGKLLVNDVSAEVPADSNVSYNISYSWGNDDTDYPTIPRSITASYYSDDGTLLYNLTLYRDSLTPSKKIPDGKDVSNWFSDWKTADDDEVIQEVRNTSEVSGFLITAGNNKNEEDSESPSYSTSTYYFAVQTADGISVYILEGIFYDSTVFDDFNTIFNNCIESISVSHDVTLAAEFGSAYQH